ncbi:tail fiber assembly protein [Dickeya undicola]|uniref:Tail fiber assembly protein n=2 Tax=Dickeya undicola TaxID=1577887 RepID=A0ABX9WP71_9GAMM|nr:tail fiber assembly protein [Dickeya undicola]
MDGRELKLSPPRPDVYHVWDVESCTWVITDNAQKQRVADQISAASLQKTRLLDDVTQRIAPLQDAVDLGIATDIETAQLTELKKYRVLLNRVDTSTAHDITWPDKPA